MHFGSRLRVLDNIFAPRWGSWGASWEVLIASSWGSWAHLGSKLRGLRPILAKLGGLGPILAPKWDPKSIKISPKSGLKCDHFCERFEERYPGPCTILNANLVSLIEYTLNFLRSDCKEAPGIPTMDTNIACSITKLLDAFISEAHGFMPYVPPESEKEPMSPNSPQLAKKEKKDDGPQGRSEEHEKKLVKMYLSLAESLPP